MRKRLRHPRLISHTGKPKKGRGVRGKVGYILVTRYNVPSRFGKKSGKLKREFSPLDKNWLEHRYSLFRHLCLPSVEQQSDQDFIWMIFFHPDTPKRYYDYLQDRWNVCFAASFSQMQGIVRQQARSHRGALISTRLDNDDCLSRRFVSTTKAIARNILENSDVFGLPHAIYYRFGLEQDVATTESYSRDYPKNAFVSLVEDIAPKGSISTVLSHAHNEMERSFNTTVIRNELPMWMINVHDTNAMNEILGHRIEDESDRSAFLGEFGMSNSGEFR